MHLPGNNQCLRGSQYWGPSGYSLGPIFLNSQGTVINSHGLSYHSYEDTHCQADTSCHCTTWSSFWTSLSCTEGISRPQPLSILKNVVLARNLGVTLDDLAVNIAATACFTDSCCTSLFLTQKATQVLVQALVISRLGCYSLQAGLPACAIGPLQLIQSAPVRPLHSITDSLLLHHYIGTTAAAQHNPDGFLSLLHNGATSPPLTSGQAEKKNEILLSFVSTM